MSDEDAFRYEADEVSAARVICAWYGMPEGERSVRGSDRFPAAVTQFQREVTSRTVPIQGRVRTALSQLNNGNPMAAQATLARVLGEPA
jgi:hypothetical protein